MSSDYQGQDITRLYDNSHKCFLKCSQFDGFHRLTQQVLLTWTDRRIRRESTLFVSKGKLFQQQFMRITTQ